MYYFVSYISIKLGEMLCSLSGQTENSINENVLILDLEKILSLDSIPSVFPTAATRVFFLACLFNNSVNFGSLVFGSKVTKPWLCLSPSSTQVEMF